MTDSHWFAYMLAAVFAGLGVMGMTAPKVLLGVDQFVAPVWPRLMTLEQRVRLQNVLSLGYANDDRVRHMGLVIAAFSFVMAGLALVPFVSPMAAGVVGFVTFGLGITAVATRLHHQGAARAAALVRRGIPWPLAVAAGLAVVSTLVTGAVPAMRPGAILAALAMVVLAFVGTRIALTPIRLRCDDPSLESAIAELVRRGQIWSITSIIGSLALLNGAFGTMARLHGGAGISGASASAIASVLAAVAVIIISLWAKRIKNVGPVLRALDAVPA